MISNKEIKLLAISDIHFGSKRNKTSKIISNFKRYVLNEQNKNLDILVIVGDFYDGLLDLKSQEGYEIDYLIYMILTYCKLNEIVLRVLEGTPSHDWTQPERFIKLNNILGYKDLDIKYVDNVAVEYMDKFDIHVLYVPDEIQPTPEKTLALVKETMMSKGLDRVDLAFMHGQFEYQLPAHIKNIPRHSSAEYLSLVKSLIFVGHIHTHSVFERIIAQGSFDRLSHGEEEPKGFVIANITNNSSEFFFIENKDAKIYKTVDCSYFELDKCLEYLKEMAASLPEDSAIRISANSNQPILANIQELVIFAPHITWTKHIRDKDKSTDNNVSELIENEEIYTPVTITKDNLVQLLTPRLSRAFEDNSLLINKSLDLIKDFL
jgi:predicted phosphodiesterase